MAKFGFEGFRQKRKIAILIGTALVLAVPTPFVVSWLESLGPQPIKNFTGIPIAFRTSSAIKIRYRKITKIPIKYVNSQRIPIAYHNLSVIKVTYRNGSDNGNVIDDPRFPTVRLRSTTFKVNPSWLNLAP